MESLIGHTKADKNENSGVSSCSLFSCCNVITEDNTDTSVEQLNFKTDIDLDEESDALKLKVDVLERKVEEAEEKINTITKEKTEATETISTLTKEKSEAEETINTLTKEKSEATKEYKLKVETLQSEIAKLREELSKKA